MREPIQFECTECRRINYSGTKDKKKHPDRNWNWSSSSFSATLSRWAREGYIQIHKKGGGPIATRYSIPKNGNYEK